MRGSTMIVCILFGLAAGWMLAQVLLAPFADQAAEVIGQDRAGRAIVPARLDEQKIRRDMQERRVREAEKARKLQ